MASLLTSPCNTLRAALAMGEQTVSTALRDVDLPSVNPTPKETLFIGSSWFSLPGPHVSISPLFNLAQIHPPGSHTPPNNHVMCLRTPSMVSSALFSSVGLVGEYIPAAGGPSFFCRTSELFSATADEVTFHSLESSENASSQGRGGKNGQFLLFSSELFSPKRTGFPLFENK